MRFLKPVCPECGEIAIGTQEQLYGLALLNFSSDGTGECEYGGETKVDWDSQVGVREEDGQLRLECSNGHVWASEVEDYRG